MKIPFRHQGRQFFFTTLTLEGRPPALSRLIDAKSPPELLPPGETALAILRAIHKVCPAVTLSERVIMPDHLHFLLIVDYDQAPVFNPLWFSFVLIEAIETAWAQIERTGTTPPLPQFSEETLATVLARARNRAHDQRTQPGSGGATPVPSILSPSSIPPSSLHFNRHPYIEIAFNSRQLKAFRRYIRLNPARAIWKREHPERFRCFENIRHPVLDPSHRWSAIGNLTLLVSPFLFPVRLTLKKTAPEHETAIVEILEHAKNGWIPVSGFISPGEVELLRRLKAEPQTHFIKVLPFTLPPNYDPSTEDSRELAADRMLILSGLPNTPELSSREITQNKTTSHQFRKNCLALNELIVELCQRAQNLSL
jgi:hypothetical protein